MSTVIENLERAQLRRVPVFDAGDRLRVHFQVVEGTRRRTQVFEGVVIKRQGHGARETFTVRKQSFGVGVERTFPLHSPKIERIEVAARGDVRRAKLYYLRDRVGKRARVRERRNTGPEVLVQRELLHAPVPEAPAVQEAPATPEAPPARGSRRPARDDRRRGCRGRWRRAGVTEKKSLPGSLLELLLIVVAALGLAARGRGIFCQALPDSQRVDGPDARGRPAGARQPPRAALLLAARRRHHRLSPAGRLQRLRQRQPGPARRRSGPAAGLRHRPGQGLLDHVHQAARRPARRSPADSRRPRDSQRRGRARQLHRGLPRRCRLQLPGYDRRARGRSTT